VTLPPVALVLAPRSEEEHTVAGLRLGERARRVAVRAGVAPERVQVVRSAEEFAQSRAPLSSAVEEGRSLLLIRATGQVVGIPLVAPLLEGEAATRLAVDPARGGEYAGALFANGDRAAAVLDALSENLEAGDGDLAKAWLGDGVESLEVGERARYPAGTRAEARAAHESMFDLVNKPLDEFLVRNFYRPAAKPMVRVFLRLPISPNGISVISSVFSLGGCAVAAFEPWRMHVLGLVLLIVGGVLDHCDGAVARLRLQTSKVGEWVDAIGDDLARLGLLLAVGLHVAPQYPDYPILWITGAALALTLTSQVLIYYYCIFVIGSSSNQDYGLLLGIGPGTEESGGRRSIWRFLADQGAVVARRIFIDPAVLAAALLSVPIASLVGLTVGSAVALAVVIPTTVRIVRGQGTAQRAE